MQNRALVGFIMSHACPLKCNFCNHTKAEVGPGRIRRHVVTETMARFAGHPEVVRFAFSGGDPFLYLADIESGVAAARTAGVRQPFHIVTSGYWAKTPGQVGDILADLKALGMDAIKLSYDTEHARFVRPEQIMTIVDAANAIDMNVEIQATFWDKTESLRDLLPELDGRAMTNSFTVVPAGRAKKNGTWPRHNLSEEQKYSCGDPGYYTVSIYPDGEAFPCCAGDFNKAAKLSCGNIYRDEPEQILRNAFGNFHVRIAKELGFGAFYALVHANYPHLLDELTPFSAVDSPCEICRDLRNFDQDKLAPLYERMEVEYVLTMAEWHWHKAAGGPSQASVLEVDGRPMDLPVLKDWLETDAAARTRFLAGELSFAAGTGR